MCWEVPEVVSTYLLTVTSGSLPLGDSDLRVNALPFVRTVVRVLYVLDSPQHTPVVPLFIGRYQTYFLPFVGLPFSLFDLLVFPGPGSCAGITPIIWSRNFLKRAPWTGFVPKSPIMSAVGHQTIDTSPFWARSVMKKYRKLMCLVRLLLDAFPFFSRRMELLLS